LGIEGCTIIEAEAANGCQSQALFDVIMLDGATEQEPTELYRQMAPDGRLVGIFATVRPPQARKVTKSTDGWVLADQLAAVGGLDRDQVAVAVGADDDREELLGQVQGHGYGTSFRIRASTSSRTRSMVTRSRPSALSRS